MISGFAITLSCWDFVRAQSREAWGLLELCPTLPLREGRNCECLREQFRGGDYLRPVPSPNSPRLRLRRVRPSLKGRVDGPARFRCYPFRVKVTVPLGL